MKYKLVYEIGDRREIRKINQKTIDIGRGPDNDLVLTDFSISRRHCRIEQDGEILMLIDLGSRNGTLVNGRKVISRQIKPGDEIMLGRFPIRLETKETSMPATGDVVLEDRPFLERPGTVIKPLTSIFEDRIGDTAAEQRLTELPKTEDKKLGSLLQLLTQVARTLISADSLEEILHTVMDLTFDHLPVERGFLMLYDEKQDVLVPTVVKERNNDKSDQLVISKTITEKVFREHVSILTSDASIDPRFSGSDSIIFQGIRSAMCVPLWNAGEVIGVLHVDSLMANRTFDTDDLDFLTALANYSAVAIQRARLHEQVRNEMEARSKLARYHSPAVVSKILASRGGVSDWNIDAQDRDVSILFADIVGFTSISEKLTPSEVGRFLNYYFSQLTSIIFKYEGTLDKFIGDALMAVFGAPIAQKDHAFRAVSAALEMRDRVAQLQFKKEVGLELELHVRIGINSGTVVAGDIGSPQRMEYTVIGDTVNAASRLEEEVAEPDCIVIGERTWKPIRKYFKFKEIGKFNVRGREGSIKCFKVLSSL